MRNLAVLLSAGILLSYPCIASQQDRPAPYRPIKGEFAIYSGELDDQQAPTVNDKKLSLIVEGSAAKDIFEAMGRDDKHVCGAARGSRSRTRGQVWCTSHPGAGYTCYFGFDLRTGKSIPGGTC